MRLFKALMIFALWPTVAIASERDYAKNEDACLKSLIEYPGSDSGLHTEGQVNGFAYTISITRHPEFDEDDATLKKEQARLREQLENIEKELAK